MKREACQLTIITVVRNGERTIRKCLSSVAAQAKFDDFEYEHIIIDGNSSDGTTEICLDFGVDVYEQLNNGIYGAMNEGVALSKGQYIVFLNSDDWFEDDAISAIRSKLQQQLVDGFFFSVNMVKDEKSNSRWDPTKTIGRRYAMPAPHPGLVMSKAAFIHLGGFDESLRYSADYDLLLRFLTLSTFSTHHEAITNFALGGASSNHAALLENRRVRKKNKLPVTQRILGRCYDLK